VEKSSFFFFKLPLSSLRGQILQADGVIFGAPTRFGMMCAQMKAFLDSMGGIWKK
jgi:NAD(P)H dehydrogenase (quinone)